MNDFILHHFPESPFSEKVRLILGAKQLAWRSVDIPVVLPKPDVLALTGGYRRTPLLQRGADVWCDSALIARVLDRAQPEPPLYPAEAAGAPWLAQWADSTLFWVAVPYVLQPGGIQHVLHDRPPEFAKAFAMDRAPFAANLTRQTLADATVALRTYLGWLEAQLADADQRSGGDAFLVNGRLSIADFAVGHILWFIHRAPPLLGILDALPRLRDWYARVAAFGHGTPTAMTSTEALAVAAASSTHAPTRVEPGLGFEAGEPVTVMPIDYGRDLSVGTLVGLDDTEVVIERRDERAGTLHVHFPRLGFQIRKEAKA